MSNAEIKITLDDNDYKAYADFSPGNGDGSKLTMEYVKKVLIEAGIVYGIDWDIIESTILFCNENSKSRERVKIATGESPKAEKPSYWNLQEKFFNNYMGFDENELKVDFHERSPFIMVKKGEIIATQKPGRPGVLGKSVKDKPIEFEKKKVVQFTPGRNTFVHENNLYAASSGRYEVSDSRVIDVNDILIIENDVDYSTGNISFAKDVIINGEVKDGFKVASGGSLYCKSNLDATDVICRNDLTVDKGIIGKGVALVRVGGKITAKFIENCDVESKSGMEIEKNIMNSYIYTLGHLNLGEKSAIVSSHITAELGITVYNIGKPGSQSSEISLGFSFVEKRSLDSLRQRIKALTEKHDHIDKMAEHRKTPKRLKLVQQMKEVLKKSKEELATRKKALYKNESAILMVNGTVYPGTNINICGIKYTVTDEASKVKFYLNSESRRIEKVPL